MTPSSRHRVWRRDAKAPYRNLQPLRRSGGWQFLGLFVFVALATASYYFVVAPLAPLSPKNARRIVRKPVDRMEIVGVVDQPTRIDRVQLFGIGKHSGSGEGGMSPQKLNGTAHNPPSHGSTSASSANSSAEALRASDTASIASAIAATPRGKAKATWSTSVATYLLVGCFFFGSYILVAKLCGRSPEWVLYLIRKRVCLFRGRDVTGVHVLEGLSVLWSLGYTPSPLSSYAVATLCTVLTPGTLVPAAWRLRL